MFLKNNLGGIILKKLLSKVFLVTAIVLVFTVTASAVGAASTVVAGDMDSSGKVNASDAVYLLYHTMFGANEYPLAQSGDLNGDGSVNANDAVYLLYNTLFGDTDYPLPDVEDKDQGFGPWIPI